MGFLDDLFSESKYLNKNKQPKKENKPEAVRPAEPAVLPVRPETGSEPDFPVPFGYKCNWLCVRSDSPEEVIQKLGLKNSEPSNWDKGIEMAYNGYRFVSPVLDGWVLVVNYGMDILTLAPELLDESAKKFPELQYFSTHRVSEYHAWVKYVNGEMVRGYGWCGCDGEVLLDRGALTPEEERLGFTNLVGADNASETAEYPDEEYVMEIAAAWGIDPGFSGSSYPKSMGFICK